MDCTPPVFQKRRVLSRVMRSKTVPYSLFLVIYFSVWFFKEDVNILPGGSGCYSLRA